MSTNSSASSVTAVSPAAPDPVLAIVGELTIATVADWQRRANAELPLSGPWTIDLAGVQALDVFGLQLLCAWGRAAVARGDRLQLQRAPAVVADAATAAGMKMEEISAITP